MIYLISCGMPERRAFKIMEAVRKGRGLPEGAEEEMKAAGVPDWYIGSCKKIAYLFPKAHAVAYVMMAFRIAWFKSTSLWPFMRRIFPSVPKHSMRLSCAWGSIAPRPKWLRSVPKTKKPPL